MSVSPKSPGGCSSFRFGAPPSPISTRQNSGASTSSTNNKFGALSVKSPRAKEVINVEVKKPKKTIKKAKTIIKTIGLLYKKKGKWFVPPRAQFSFNGEDDIMKNKAEEKIALLQA